MTAYYNEYDPFAAAWLRELIKAGMIAPGDVDERSILDVRADELAGYTKCHFFAGIGVWSYSLRQAGWPNDRQVWTGSPPCQPFSSAGKQLGTADERHASRPGPTNSFWRDADWLGCRDGKFRPVEPGTFPLANGATNRVGRLRGYGNAINAEAARAFIEAYMDTQ